MKVCIVTVYNSVNSGSYWQAAALKQQIERYGHEVVFLDRSHTGSSASKVYQMKEIIKRLLKGQFYSAAMQNKIYQEFRNEQSDFRVIAQDEILVKGIDIIILGSDTIWNLEKKYFSDFYKTYWGGCFGHIKVSPYAASIANTSLEVIQKYPDINQYVEQWEAIGVRDQHTYNVISEITNRHIDIVCDPTLLLNKNDYASMIQKPEMKNYIFLYLFEEIAEEHNKQLVEFARTEGLHIISGTLLKKSAFEVVVNSPKSFLRYMYYAKYVITDTFHGTVFSVNLEKQFVTVERGKKKVDNFLSNVGFDDRLISRDKNLIETLSFNIDYSKRFDKVLEFRENSKRYLEQVLNSSVVNMEG